MLSEKELNKRATILNVLELAFNERQDLYAITIDQESKKDNLFTCKLFNASDNTIIRELTANYGTIKRYILSLPIIKACNTDNLA